MRFKIQSPDTMLEQMGTGRQNPEVYISAIVSEQ